MDHLSIIVSRLALLTTVATVTKKIQSIRGADEALRAVVDDLSDIQVLVQQVYLLDKQHETHISEEQQSRFQGRLARLEEKLGELGCATQQEILIARSASMPDLQRWTLFPLNMALSRRGIGVYAHIACLPFKAPWMRVAFLMAEGLSGFKLTKTEPQNMLHGRESIYCFSETTKKLTKRSRPSCPSHTNYDLSFT
jgi:hypothetical protein